ncbi:MAG: hypothetical protein ACJ8ER_06435 [Allosphingosinicella sp.]
MATKINSLDAWVATRNALAQDLSSTLEFLSTTPFSSDPASDFQQAKAQRDRIIDQLQQLAVAGIEQIDEAIAAGPLLQQIGDLAQQANKEADALKNATKTVTKIASVVDQAAGVVTKIAQLPFV